MNGVVHRCGAFAGRSRTRYVEQTSVYGETSVNWSDRRIEEGVILYESLPKLVFEIPIAIAIHWEYFLHVLGGTRRAESLVCKLDFDGVKLLTIEVLDLLVQIATGGLSV